MASRKALYHLLALAVVAVWGVTFVCTKTLIGAGMHPAAIFFIRFSLAYVGIWILTLTGKGKTRLFCDNWKDELMCLFLGVTGGSLYFLTENTALAYTQAANVAFLVCVAPVFTAIFTLFGKKFLRGRFADGLENIKVRFNEKTGVLGSLLYKKGKNGRQIAEIRELKEDDATLTKRLLNAGIEVSSEVPDSSGAILSFVFRPAALVCDPYFVRFSVSFSAEMPEA